MNRFLRTFSLVTLAFSACTDSTGSGLGPPAQLLIQTSQPTGVFGQALPTAPTVLVTDANDHPVPGVMVTFAITSGGGSVSSTTQTTNATGLASVVWTLGNAFGTNTLTATVAQLSPVTFSAMAIAPDSGILAFNLVDPTGDTLNTFAETSPTPQAIDLLSLRGDFKGDALVLTATFSAPVTSGSNAPNFLRGIIEFDIDDNPSTGGPFFSTSYGGSGSLGMDYRLSFSGLNAGISDNSPAPQPPNPLPIQVSYSGSTVVLRVPMLLLGNDDGNFSLVGVIGTIDRATDVFPNTGETTVRRGISVSSTMNDVSGRPRGPAATHNPVRWESLAVRAH
jgi:Macroglobulin domain MG4